MQSDYQYEKTYESSPRSMTIDQLNDNYQRQSQDTQQFTFKSSVNTEIIKNERTQRQHDQYTENYQKKIDNLSQSLSTLEQEIKLKIKKESESIKINEDSQLLDSLEKDRKEVEFIESVKDNSCITTANLINNVKRDMSSQFLSKINAVGRNDKGSIMGMLGVGNKEEKINIQFDLNSQARDAVCKNLGHFQMLEQKTAMVEKILGVNLTNQYDLKLNLKLERNINDLEELTLNSDECQKRIKILRDDMENLKQKKQEIGFKDEELQMIQNIWQLYNMYSQNEPQITPLKQRMTQLKTIYEESDKIAYTVQQLQSIDKKLNSGLKAFDQELEDKKIDYQEMVQQANQRMKKIEQALRL